VSSSEIVYALLTQQIEMTDCLFSAHSNLTHFHENQNPSGFICKLKEIISLVSKNIL
jgi:hypothetical protein